MCGRFTLYHDEDEIISRFDAPRFEASPDAFSPTPRYNIAPTQSVAAVTQNGTCRLRDFRWGLIPSWAKDPAIGTKMINARAETVAEKPAYRTALLRRRCSISRRRVL